MSDSDLFPRALAWMQAQDDIRAALLLGSRAREDGTQDALSDYDLIVYTSDIERYRARGHWYDQLGVVWLCSVEPWRSGWPEHMIIFEGGQKIDFAFAPLDHLRDVVQAQSLPVVEAYGYRIALDKDGLAAQLPPPTFAPPAYTPPSQTEFSEVIEQFWFSVFQAARSLARADLWFALYRDRALKDTLLIMLEWHAKATRGAAVNTWYRGRWLRKWVDDATLTAVGETCAHFDTADGWRALHATMALFRQLAADTAAHYGFTYPAAVDANISGYVHQLAER